MIKKTSNLQVCLEVELSQAEIYLGLEVHPRMLEEVVACLEMQGLLRNNNLKVMDRQSHSLAVVAASAVHHKMLQVESNSEFSQLEEEVYSEAPTKEELEEEVCLELQNLQILKRRKRKPVDSQGM